MDVKRDLSSSDKDRLLRLAKRLQATPEAAYEERGTVAIWRDFLGEFGIPMRWGLGGRAPIVEWGSYGNASVSVAVTADLDAVGVPSGEAWRCEHTCGHFAQSVHALGLAHYLYTYSENQEVAVRVIGTPGEECRPLYDRTFPLPYMPGKRLLLNEGWFNGTDVVLSTHLADHLSTRSVQIVNGASGMVGVRLTQVKFEPDDDRPQGVRTLAGFMELWQDELRRVIGRMSRVRTRSFTDGIELWFDIPRACVLTEEMAQESLARVVKHSGVEARLISVYAPLTQSEALRKTALGVLKSDPFAPQIHRVSELPGATDLGDVSRLYPTLQLFVGGTTGSTHHSDFRVVDREFAFLWPIQWLVNMMAALSAK